MAKKMIRNRKLEELILYISSKCQDHGKFGVTKLNKILYYSDFIAYAKRGKPVTGAEYFKIKFGPAPRPMKPTLNFMRENGDIAIVLKDTLAGTQKRPGALRLPDLDVFDAWELSIVDDVILALKDKSAEEVSDLTHYHVGWKLANDGETIPYFTVFCRDTSDVDITQEDISNAQETEKKFGLTAS